MEIIFAKRHFSLTSANILLPYNQLLTTYDVESTT